MDGRDGRRGVESVPVGRLGSSDGSLAFGVVLSMFAVSKSRDSGDGEVKGRKVEEREVICSCSMRCPV